MDDLWLDAVLAVPAVGFQLKAPASLAVTVREVVAPALDQLANSKDLTIAERSGPTGLEFRVTSKDGFTHKIVLAPGGCNVSVEFSFVPIEKRVAGELPSTSYALRTYTTLTNECFDRLEILVTPLLRVAGTEITRIGLAASSELALAQLPPGFVQYKEWSERPWKKGGADVTKLQALTLMKLPATAEGHDQCHHALTYELVEGVSDVMFQLVLDYQRMFAKPPARNTVDMTSFATKAMAYFQTFSFPEARSWH